MTRAAIALVLAACGAPRGGSAPDPLADRFPLAKLDDRALCDQLLARTPEQHRKVIDAEPKLRRKVVVSDLHLGPGTTDDRFTGIEDFYADAEWSQFLAREAAAGPTDLIIAGDFIEFWQIATALGALPKRDSSVQPAQGTVLAADQSFGVAAAQRVIAAHRSVFADLGAFLASGDHRVIIIPGNHDADLGWPKVQLTIARAIAPRDPTRLMFVDGASYEHGGVHVEHGHAYDAANKFATGHAPFGRDRDGNCRLQSSWGEVFVDQFYTEAERQVPFIDNLSPQSAAILWTMRADPNPERDIGAALRFLELIRVGETRELNRNAIGGLLQGVLGTPGKRDRGPESMSEVVDHLSDRLVDGDTNIEPMLDALVRLTYDPELRPLWLGIVRAAGAMPNLRAALGELRAIDPDALSKLRDRAFGDAMDTAATRILSEANASVVVFGHTHDVGGFVHSISSRGRAGYYANTGSWISVASVADLRARGITWDKLSLADRKLFPSRMTSVLVEYRDGAPQKPLIR